MRYVFRALVLVLLIPVAAGCTSAISASPLADVGRGPLGTVVVKGLQDASYNLDSAVTIGVLTADDPAPKCFHAVLTQLNADPTNPAPASASFEPRVSDLVSLGSVLYIKAKQLQQAQGGGVTVPASCKELVAQFLLDAAGAGVRGLPGGGLLPILK